MPLALKSQCPIISHLLVITEHSRHHYPTREESDDYLPTLKVEGSEVLEPAANSNILLYWLLALPASTFRALIRPTVNISWLSATQALFSIQLG